MNLNQAKELLAVMEPLLANAPFVIGHTFERNGRKLSLAITEHFRQACKKGRVWKSKAMLTALKNAEYGFDPHHAHSPGGYDGIFVLTRDYQPKNEMMRKLFDHFLDKPGSEAASIAQALHVPLSSLKPVRLVSHQMRLLGLLLSADNHDTLVLIDYDDTK